MEKKACEHCYHNKWKTKEKGKKYQCRNCGHVREITKENEHIYS